MWRGRPQGRSARDPYVVLLLAQLINQIARLEHKPPVTLTVIAGCFLTFFQDVLPWELRSWIPSVNKACLQPYLILQNRQWRRLFWSAFLHADEIHLYYNMSSMLWKGVQLEHRYGSGAFALLLAELLVLSHSMFVALAVLAAEYVPEFGYLYLSNCAIGFSAVLFGLKVVLNHDAPGFSNVFGLTLPTKYLAWAELVLASALNPQASFMGHLAGIFAGLLHVRVLAPAFPLIMRAWRRARLSMWLRLQPGPARFAGGTSGHRGAAGGANGSRAAAAAPQQHVYTGRSRSGAAEDASAGQGAAAAAEQRRQLEQRQGLGSAQAGQGHRVSNGQIKHQISSSPLSAEELRLRRLQRFGS